MEKIPEALNNGTSLPTKGFSALISHAETVYDLADLVDIELTFYQSWYWTVLGTGPLVRTASSRGGPVLDLGTGRPVLS
jgi:hypothetical protein